MSDDPGGLPVVDPDEVRPDRTEADRARPRRVGTDEGGPDGPIDGPVAGVLLAAGTSSRFDGGNKLLADLDGEPVVRGAGRALAGADLDGLVAVLGRDADAVGAGLSDLGFALVENPDYAAGQATSVGAGIRALLDETAGAGGPSPTAVVFALGDAPLVEPASVDALVAAYRTGRWSALAAACDGRRGNPVLFDARHFGALAALEGDTGGREILLTADAAALVETGDPGVLRDVDTRADLERLRED